MLREPYIGNTLLDASVSQFLLNAAKDASPETTAAGIDSHFAVDSHPPAPAAVGVRVSPADDAAKASAKTTATRDEQYRGHAVGPKWTQQLSTGCSVDPRDDAAPADLSHIHFHNRCDVQYVSSSYEPSDTPVAAHPQPAWTATRSKLGSPQPPLPDTPPPFDGWPIYLRLSDGSTLGADWVVSATGVTPAPGVHGYYGAKSRLPQSPDGGITVDTTMQCIGLPNVFAAGDAATVQRDESGDSSHWFQMRLWSQVRRTSCRDMHSQLLYTCWCAMNGVAPCRFGVRQCSSHTSTGGCVCASRREFRGKLQAWQ